VQRISNDAETRPPTPEPENPPSIPPPAAFRELSRKEQLILLRPTFLRIINEQYPPAQPRINLFFLRKQAQLDNMAKYGDITEEEMADVFLPELRRWAEREDRWVDGERSPEPPRPTGSPAYEALSPKKRLAFVLDVLRPEAVIALCIHSNGIDEGSEQATYDRARALLGDLAAEDERCRWSNIAMALNSARRIAREKQGLPAEHLAGDAMKDAVTRYEAKKYDEELEKETRFISRAGSTRKKVNYREDDDE
jgi:hypothetical protein